jgi:NAD-dependent SIR2 family protein deacetylase
MARSSDSGKRLMSNDLASEITPSKKAAYARRWRDLNRDELRAYQREYSAKQRKLHPEKAKSYTLAWRKRNPDKARAITNAGKRKEKTGFTRQLWHQTLFVQDFRCANCGWALTLDKSRTGACADHDHNTGQPRGILCGSCNSSLGFMRENVAAIRSLADYAERWKG